MAIATAYNFYIAVASTPGSTSLTDLSSRCVSLKVNMPQAANEAQAAGDTHKKYRPGAGDPSIEATFRSDQAVSNVQHTLRAHRAITSTGFTVLARPLNAARSSANPEFGGQMAISGDVMEMDDNWGDVPSITVKFVPFGAFSADVSTS
jgi:hypothetical protein